MTQWFWRTQESHSSPTETMRKFSQDAGENYFFCSWFCLGASGEVRTHSNLPRAPSVSITLMDLYLKVEVSATLDFVEFMLMMPSLALMTPVSVTSPLSS